MDSDNFLSGLNDKLKIGPVSEIKNDVLISDMISGEVKLLSVVESMQEVLTSQDVTTREHGVDFLSWVLTEIPVNLLTDRELNVILSFYLDRLKDHHNLLPAVIKGLLAIIKMDQLVKEGMIQMLSALFQHVNCRSQVQQDRHNLYSIFKYIIENRLEHVKTMGPDFVFGIISFADGETDPKNLLLLFRCLPLFLKNFQLGHLVEETFEVLSCYFPVDFNAAARNNMLITREDLSDSLMQCLSAAPEFSEFCIPLIIEKLESSLKSSKIDSYRLLQECCNSYKADDIHKYLNQLWKMIQKDVLPGSDREICHAGLSALAELVKMFSDDDTQKVNLFEFLNDVVSGVKSLLNKVDDSLFQSAMNVLAAACCKSKQATEYIISQFKPFYQLDFTKSSSERKIILTSLLPFTSFIQKFSVSKTPVFEKCSSFSQIVDLYFDSVCFNDKDVRKLAWIGIQRLVTELDESMRRKLISLLIEDIRSEDCEYARAQCLKVLRDLAAVDHSGISQIVSTLLQLKAELTVGQDSKVKRTLSALSKIADLPDFTSKIISFFLDLIAHSDYYVLGLQYFLEACVSQDEVSSTFKSTAYIDIDAVDKLITWWLENTSRLDESILFLVAEIVESIMRSQEVDVQQAAVDKYLSFFLGSIRVSNGAKPDNSHLLFSFSSSPQAVILLEAVVGSVKQNVKIQFFFDAETKLKDLALSSNNNSVRTSASRLLASLINKSDQSVTDELFSKLTTEILTTLNDEAQVPGDKCRAAELLAWITKAVVLKGIPNLDAWLAKWFSLLAHEDVGHVVANGFQIVLDEDKLYLKHRSHCNVRILYRQRLFLNFPQLASVYQTCSDSVKTNYLLALTRLIQGVPNHVLLTEISSVVILLLQSLDFLKPEILTGSLETLMTLLEDKQDIFSGFAESFLSKFLKLAQLEGHMRIRIQALKCIFHYGFYPTAVLLPIKLKVVRGLEPCLDDRKRLVRSEAVKARTRWYLVGAPGEDAVFSR